MLGAAAGWFSSTEMQRDLLCNCPARATGRKVFHSDTQCENTVITARITYVYLPLNLFTYYICIFYSRVW